MLYQYQPLKGVDDIRVVKVSRSTGRHQAVEFSLHHVHRRSRCEYEALSYTWGHPRKCKSIHEIESGAELEVTENCFSALYQLCNRGPRTLWVDAVCINQDDNEEKSWQVARLADVYRNATRTVVYLGEEDEHWSSLSQYFEQIRPGSTDKRLRGVSDDVPYDTNTHRHSFAQRPWFSRTWTVQEAVLSKRNAVMARIGTQDVEFHTLCQWLSQETGELYAALGYGETDPWRDQWLEKWRGPRYGRHL